MPAWKRKDRRSSIDNSHRDPEPLEKVISSQPRAVCLYYALVEYAQARGLQEIWLTRHQMARLVGVSAGGTISAALTKLANSAWIVKDVYNVQNEETGNVDRKMRITFHRKFGDKKNFPVRPKREPEPPAEPSTPPQIVSGPEVLEIETLDDIPEEQA